MLIRHIDNPSTVWDFAYNYLYEIFGDIPDCRTIGFEKMQEPYLWGYLLNKNETPIAYLVEQFYEGRDVIRLEVRTNYISKYQLTKWLNKNRDKLLRKIYDYDSVTCYFKAIINDDYNKIIEMFKKENKHGK